MLKHLTTLQNHDDRVWCVSWNPKGTLLASCGGDRKIKIWARNQTLKTDDNKSNNLNDDKQNLCNDWSCIATLSDGHTRTIRWVSWSPCGNKLASASFDTSITIWKRNHNNTFEVLLNLEGHENEVKCTAWSHDGCYLASCSRDRSVWIWDVSEGEDFECNSVLTIHSQDVKHVTWHPNKNLLVSSSYDNTIKISAQDDDDWACLESLESHESTVWSCDFNSDGKKLISCSEDRTLKIWKQNEDLDSKDNKKQTWSCLNTISGYHTRTIFSVKWSHLNNLIATACADNSIHIFKENDLTSQNPETQDSSLILLFHQKNAHNQDVNCVDWNPTQLGLLASCSDDGSIKLWMFIEND